MAPHMYMHFLVALTAYRARALAVVDRRRLHCLLRPVLGERPTPYWNLR